MILIILVMLAATDDVSGVVVLLVMLELGADTAATSDVLESLGKTVLLRDDVGVESIELVATVVT